MKFFLKSILPLLVIGILFTGCEKQEYFKSEKGIEDELHGNWKRVQISSSDPIDEIWSFNGGSLVITVGTTTVATGTYSIKTTLFKVFINTDGLPGDCINDDIREINSKWQVISLHDGVLDMATDACSGVIEREFTKQ